MTEIRLEAVFPMDAAAFLRDRWTREWMGFNATHSGLMYHELREAYEKVGPDGTLLMCKMEALGVDQDLPAKAAEFFGLDDRVHGFEVKNAYRWRKAMTLGPPPYELQVRTAISLMQKGVGVGTLTLSDVQGQPGWCKQTLRIDLNVGVEMLGSLVERLIAGAFEDQNRSLPKVQMEWSARRYAQQGSFRGGEAPGLRRDGGDDHGEEEAGSTPFPSFRGPGSMSGPGSVGGAGGLDPLELAGKLEAVGNGGYMLSRPATEAEGKVSLDWLTAQKDAAEAAEPPTSWKDRVSSRHGDGDEAAPGSSNQRGAAAAPALPAGPGSPAKRRQQVGYPSGSFGPSSTSSTAQGPMSASKIKTDSPDLYAQLFMMDEYDETPEVTNVGGADGGAGKASSSNGLNGARGRQPGRASDEADAVAALDAGDELRPEGYNVSPYRRRGPAEREERGSWWCCCPPKSEPRPPPAVEQYRPYSPVARMATPMHRRRRSHGSLYGAAHEGVEPDSPGAG